MRRSASRRGTARLAATAGGQALAAARETRPSDPRTVVRFGHVVHDDELVARLQDDELVTRPGKEVLLGRRCRLDRLVWMCAA
jgi:hypothetical protein